MVVYMHKRTPFYLQNIIQDIVCTKNLHDYNISGKLLKQKNSA